MLIIPMTGKLSKQNPPLVTIAIILINCFVYFFLQAEDNERYQNAMAFYFESGLAEIEASRYLEYLEERGESGEMRPAEEGRDLKHWEVMKLCRQMREDPEFYGKLLNDEIIVPSDQDYSVWKGLRARFEQELSRIFSRKYGFIPAGKSILASFTYMFLHGSFMHLLGNMIFLWLVGCVLELGCGRKVYISLYVVTGLISVWTFGLVYSTSTVPLIGASGSISGLIGAYTVMYGRRKIKVFYSLGFYFNYVRVSAIVLLPIWIGKEFFQLFFGGITHVAYVAHIGGLASGALMGYINRRYFRMSDESVFQERPQDRIPGMIEEAMEKFGSLDMEGARALLEDVLEIDPDNTEALVHLFNVEKLAHGNDNRFHRIASRLLIHLCKDHEDSDNMYRIYREYRRLAKPMKLRPDVLFRINSRLCENGHLEESEHILAALVRKQPTLNKIPSALLNLARAYQRKGREEKADKCLKVIIHKYPESMESRMAVKALKS